MKNLFQQYMHKSLQQIKTVLDLFANQGATNNLAKPFQIEEKQIKYLQTRSNNFSRFLKIEEEKL